MDTIDLHDRLHRIADRTAPEPADAAAVVRTVAARSRAQRRQRIGVGAVALAVAAVVAVVPAVLPGSGRPASPASPSTTTSGAGVLDAPTRGNLAGDAVFVEAVRQLPWTVAADPDAPTAQAEPPLESRRVLFAGDVPGGRWAAVAGADVTGATGSDVLWFLGAPGAAADALQPVQLSAGLDVGDPVALTDAGTGTLVVLAAPGDTVEVSDRPDVAADGTIARSWRPVDAGDGAAVTTLPVVATAYDEGVRYRVLRDGARLVTALPPGHRAGGYDPPDPALTWLRGPEDPAVTTALTGAAADTLTRIGLSPAEVPFEVLWSDDVPGPDGRGTQLSLLTATLPSGATYTEAWLTRSVAGGTQPGALCGSELRAAGARPDQQVFAVRCDDGLLAVVAPSATVGARLVDDAGQPLATYDLDGGVGVVTGAPVAARVQVLAADGSVLDERPLMGRVDLGRG